MRVIAGTARGTPLRTPSGETVRPTTDRVRESLFSMLGDLVEGAEVLDLFAGSGSLGIEALSRGARRVTFVENHRATVRCLEQNLKRAGFTDQTVRVQSVEAFLRLETRHGSRRYDLILADPPYATREGDVDFIRLLLEDPALRQLLEGDGLLVMEVPRRQPPPDSPNWTVVESRAYGTNQLWFLRETTDSSCEDPNPEDPELKATS